MTFLEATGQLKTFYLGTAISVGGAILMIIGLRAGESAAWVIDPILLALVGIVFGIGGFTWLCFALKCPKCRTRILWNAAAHGPTNFMADALFSPKCAVCGYQPK